MKMKYIKPVILCCYDIDMSIIAATAEVKNGKTDDSDAIVDKIDTGGSTEDVPDHTKGTSWNLWEDEEENSFY